MRRLNEKNLLLGAPERAGISYMMSPVLRTYTNPEESDSVETTNNPHVMHYAPNVSNNDIGGAKQDGMYPFTILHGVHGYTIQFLGLTERAAINKEYKEMLARLCEIKKSGVCQKSNGQDQTPMHDHD